MGVPPPEDIRSGKKYRSYILYRFLGKATLVLRNEASLFFEQTLEAYIREVKTELNLIKEEQIDTKKQLQSVNKQIDSIAGALLA